MDEGKLLLRVEHERDILQTHVDALQEALYAEHRKCDRMEKRIAELEDELNKTKGAN